MTTGQKNAVLEQYFVSFGIPRERLVLEEESFNSRMEVEAFGRYAGQLILVSNAYHVPRLMKLAELDDLEALAAPAGMAGFFGGIRGRDSFGGSAGGYQTVCLRAVGNAVSIGGSLPC